MKREQKSLTNKGFSLVELIIVVAIMAVLIGVLAPQYLRYVEKTRLQRDNTSIADFANVLKIAAAEEAINAEVAGAPATYDFNTAAPYDLQASGSTKLDAEVKLTVDLKDVKLTSNSYTKLSALPSITVSIPSTGDNKGIVQVTCTNWVDTPNGSPSSTPKKF